MSLFLNIVSFIGLFSEKRPIILRSLLIVVTPYYKTLQYTARSVEDETPNARWNPYRNPEWWGDFSQLVEIEKLKFLCISRYKFKLRF